MVSKHPWGFGDLCVLQSNYQISLPTVVTTCSLAPILAFCATRYTSLPSCPTLTFQSAIHLDKALFRRIVGWQELFFYLRLFWFSICPASPEVLLKCQLVYLYARNVYSFGGGVTLCSCFKGMSTNSLLINFLLWECLRISDLILVTKLWQNWWHAPPRLG